MDLLVVGIDVSKDWLDVAVRPTGASFTFRRTAVGIDDLIAWLNTLAPKMVAIEATGGFETVAAAGLAGAGLPVVVVNPAQVRAFAQALGKRTKTSGDCTSKNQPKSGRVNDFNRLSMSRRTCLCSFSNSSATSRLFTTGTPQSSRIPKLRA
jgi:Transposase